MPRYRPKGVDSLLIPLRTMSNPGEAVDELIARAACRSGCQTGGRCILGRILGLLRRSRRASVGSRVESIFDV